MQSCMSQYYNYSIIRNRRPTSSPQSTVPTKSFWTEKTRFVVEPQKILTIVINCYSFQKVWVPKIFFLQIHTY
jgi:hypothetical protein